METDQTTEQGSQCYLRPPQGWEHDFFDFGPDVSCVVSLRRGLSTRELKEDLIKRLLHGHGAQALVGEAAAVLLFYRRRLVSRPDSLALIDDAGRQSGGSSRRAGRSLSTMDERRSRDMRRRGTRRNNLGRGVRETATVRGTAGCEPGGV